MKGKWTNKKKKWVKNHRANKTQFERDCGWGGRRGGSWGMKQERKQPSCDCPAISQAARQLIFRYVVHSFNLTGFSPPLLVYFFISFFFSLSFLNLLFFFLFDVNQFTCIIAISGEWFSLKKSNYVQFTEKVRQTKQEREKKKIKTIE